MARTCWQGACSPLPQAPAIGSVPAAHPRVPLGCCLHPTLGLVPALHSVVVALGTSPDLCVCWGDTGPWQRVLNPAFALASKRTVSFTGPLLRTWVTSLGRE